MANELPLRNINPHSEREDGYWDHILLQRNDPDLTYFDIGTVDDEFLPHDDDWARAGECLGRNNYVEHLGISLDWPEEESWKFESLCRGLRHNTSIKSIRIFWYLCEGIGYAALTPFFQNNTLECLDIEYDDETEGTVGTRRLASALAKFNSLTEFSIGIGFVTEEVLQEVMAGLSGHPNLKKLCLGLGVVGHIGQPKRLEQKSLSTLASLLQNPNSALSKLSFYGYKGMHDEGMVALTAAMAGNTTLKELELEFRVRGNTTKVGFMAFCHSLQSPQAGLESLTLKGVHSLYEGAVASLTNALAINTNLVSLCLQENSVSEWQALLAYLQNGKCKLRHLSLRNNLLPENIEILLFNGLADNKLISLDLSSNGGLNTSRSWNALSTILQDPNCLLEKLNLCYNPIGLEEVAVLAESLSNNHRLKELILVQYYNSPGISNEFWPVFAQILYGKANIMSTYLSNHTLHTLALNGDQGVNDNYDVIDDGLPSELLALRTNREYNNRDAARQKIIKCFFKGDYNIPHSDMESKVLPYLISWLGEYTDEGEGNDQDVCAFSLMFQVVQGTPALFSFLSQSKKRKLAHGRFRSMSRKV